MSVPAKHPDEIPGLSSLIDRYDAFFLDQYGVLHDGSAPYPGALDCLEKLSVAGKQVVILSNSGKRAAENEARMARLGFDVSRWNLFLSSGEAAWRIFAQALADGRIISSAKCYLISRDNDRSAVSSLDLESAADPGIADIILISASEGDRRDLAYYKRLLKGAAAKRTPCYCTNPDRVMLTPDGPKFGAGRIAELYESLGGDVTYIGKPYAAIYDAALSAAGSPSRDRVLCVGDSVEHDIAGAAGAGLGSALVRTGIGTAKSGVELTRDYKTFGARPDFVLPGFIW